MANPKLDMLRNMMLGIPTPETQELAIKNTLYADKNNIGKYDERTIQEMAHSMPIPDMTGVQPTLVPGMAAPMIAEEDIMLLMQGKRPQPKKQSPQRQEHVVRQLIQEHINETPQAQDDYWGLAGGGRQPRNITADMERESGGEFNVQEELKRRMAKRQQQAPAQRVIQEQARPKTAPARQAPIAGGEELEDMIEDIVYKVLAQIINEAVRKKMGI